MCRLLCMYIATYVNNHNMRYNIIERLTWNNFFPPWLLTIWSLLGSKVALPAVICLFLMVHCSGVLSTKVKSYAVQVKLPAIQAHNYNYLLRSAILVVFYSVWQLCCVLKLHRFKSGMHANSKKKYGWFQTSAAYKASMQLQSMVLGYIMW